MRKPTDTVGIGPSMMTAKFDEGLKPKWNDFVARDGRTKESLSFSANIDVGISSVHLLIAVGLLLIALGGELGVIVGTAAIISTTTWFKQMWPEYAPSLSK
mgnify:CR=1 FL=1